MTLKTTIVAIFLSFIASTVLGSRSDGDKAGDRNKVSIDDLLSLEKQNDWIHLSTQLEMVPLPLRNESWTRLLNESAVRVLKSLDVFEVPTEAFLRAEDLLVRYPELSQNRVFMDRRGSVGLKFFERCFENSKVKTKCAERLKEFVVKDVLNSDLAFQAGKVIRENLGDRAAALYFDKAFSSAVDEPKCTDEDVRLAILNGLGLPGGKNSEHLEVIRIAVRIASTICWNPWQETLLELFAKDRHAFQANVCHFMREKRAITAQQAHLCM